MKGWRSSAFAVGFVDMRVRSMVRPRNPEDLGLVERKRQQGAFAELWSRCSPRPSGSASLIVKLIELRKVARCQSRLEEGYRPFVRDDLTLRGS